MDEQIEGLPPGATTRPLTPPAEEIEGLPAGAEVRPLEQKKEEPKESWWHKTFAPRGALNMPGASAKPTGEMPGSFEGHPENVGEYLPASVGEVAGGVKDVVTSMYKPKVGDVAHGAHRIISGGMNALAPTLPFVAAAAPVGTALALTGSYLGQKAGQATAEYAGAEPGGGVSELSGDIGSLAGGVGGAKLAGHFTPGAMEARRVAQGPKNLETALATPAGKAGARAAAMKEDLSVATADLAAIEKETPAKVTAILKRGKGAENFHELAEKIDDRQDKMWDEGHRPGIERHAQAEINHAKPYEAGRAALTPEAADAAPQEAAAAQKWLDESINKPRNLQSADALIRELNADLKGKDVGTRYGPLQIRARQAVVKALRDEVDRVLDVSGEQGVKGVNRRWGALENIKGRLRERAVQEAQREAKGGVLPDWVHLYSFLHPGAGATMGVSVAAGKMLRPTAATTLTKGMRQLGRTSLEAPFEAPTPENWRPGVETRPERLLPAPAPQLAPPAEPAIPARGAVEAKRQVYRDPATGRMLRGHTGEPATEPSQGRVADYWSGEQGPVKGEYVPPEKAEQAISHEPLAKLRGRKGARNQGVQGGVEGKGPVLLSAGHNLNTDEAINITPEDTSRQLPLAAERRSTPRDTGGPDFWRTTRLNQLRTELEGMPEGRDKDIMQQQYEDMKAHPFERAEGETDIGRIKAKTEKTKTRAEAEQSVKERKAGQAARFKKGAITDEDVEALHGQLDKAATAAEKAELIKKFFKAKKGDIIQ